MNFTEKIISDFRKLGLKEDDVILVHSSYKSMGENDLKFEELIKALKETVKSGTLMMPTLSYNTVNKENPIFDVEKTPSCVGAISEYFRKSDGVSRSLAPTHSVAIWGKNAKEIAENHFKDNTPCGDNSPFNYLRENDGKIIMLGCGLFCNTSMHGIEETQNPDYLFKGECEYKIIDKDKNELKNTVKSHYFKNTVQRYDRITEVLSFEKGEIKKGNVLSAECFVIDSKSLWDKVTEKMKEDNHYFVDILPEN